jgi:dUTPase
MTIINVKRNSDKAHLPKFLTKNSASANLVAVEIVKNSLFNVVYDCKIMVDIPEGYVGLILPKHSTLSKSLVMTTPASVVHMSRDCFRISFHRTFWGMFSRKRYEIGEAIAELLVFRIVEIKYKDVKSFETVKRPSKNVKQEPTR